PRPNWNARRSEAWKSVSNTSLAVGAERAARPRWFTSAWTSPAAAYSAAWIASGSSIHPSDSNGRSPIARERNSRTPPFQTRSYRQWRPYTSRSYARPVEDPMEGPLQRGRDHWPVHWLRSVRGGVPLPRARVRGLPASAVDARRPRRLHARRRGLVDLHARVP